MDVQLFRIDDRLIHGQVLLGWAKPLKSDRILLCDDEVSQNDWEKELYCSCVMGNLTAMVCSVKETASILSATNDHDKTIVIVKEPKVVMDIVGEGYIPATVNLGGIHFADNRKRYLPYVYLNTEEVNQLQWLLNKGISIFCQDVPTGKRYDMKDIVGEAPL